MALTWVRTHDWDVSAWRTRSACRDSDPDVFFPIGSSGPAVEQIETARRICTACPVSDECLEFALATNQEAGIWGGTTEEERRKLRKAWLGQAARRRLTQLVSSYLRLRRSRSGSEHAVPALRTGTVRCTRVPRVAAQLDRAARARW